MANHGSPNAHWIHRNAIYNTAKASCVSLILARLFGCRITVHEYGVAFVISRWRGNYYMLGCEYTDFPARDATGLYAHLPIEQRPSFHELLPLGEHLRERQGWTAQHIQRLRGHTQESTTKIYLEGNDWTTVEVPHR